MLLQTAYDETVYELVTYKLTYYF